MIRAFRDHLFGVAFVCVLLAWLSARDQAIIEFMIEGRSGSKIARKLKVCNCTVRNSKRNQALKILEFMGADILAEVHKSPRWKQDLQAIREKLACREERKHLSTLQFTLLPVTLWFS